MPQRAFVALILTLIASAALARGLLLSGSGGQPPAPSIVDIQPHSTTLQTSAASGTTVTTYTCTMSDASTPCPPTGSGYVWSIATQPSFLTVNQTTGALTTTRALSSADACTPAQDNCTFPVTIGPPTVAPPPLSLNPMTAALYYPSGPPADPVLTTSVYPINLQISPQTLAVGIGATGNVATITPAMSDNSTPSGSFSTIPDSLFTMSGNSLNLSRATVSGDAGLHTFNVTWVQSTTGAQIQLSLSVHVGGIPCDIGPPAVSVPVQAQNAGFTTCAMNLDFSQPLYQQASNWTYVNYFSSPQPPNTLGTGFIFFPSSGGIKFFPQQSYTQVYDAQSNSNVMNFHWDTQQNGGVGLAWSNVGQSNQVGVSTWNQSVNGYSGAYTWTVGNYYMENVGRLKATFVENTNDGGPDDIYMYSPDGHEEADVPEFQTNQGTFLGVANSCVAGIYVNNGYPTGSGFASTNWQASPNTLFVNAAGYTCTQYHKYAVLRTSDGATDLRFCAFLDDQMQGFSCGPATEGVGGAVHKVFTNRSGLFMSAGSNNGTAKNPIDYMVQRVTIWSCPTYQTTMCNGTTLVTTTNNGMTETYYH